jgi:hypothetical protein
MKSDCGQLKSVVVLICVGTSLLINAPMARHRISSADGAQRAAFGRKEG